MADTKKEVKIAISVVDEASANTKKIATAFTGVIKPVKDSAESLRVFNSINAELNTSLSPNKLNEYKAAFDRVLQALNSGAISGRDASEAFLKIFNAGDQAVATLKGLGDSSSTLAHSWEELTQRSVGASKATLDIAGASDLTKSSLQAYGGAVQNTNTSLSTLASSIGGPAVTALKVFSGVALNVAGTVLNTLGSALKNIASITTNIVSSAFNAFTGFLSRVAEIAGGIVVANVFMKIADGIRTMAQEAFAAATVFQGLQIRFEGLIAREIAGQLTREAVTQKTVSSIVNLTEAQTEALVKLREEYRLGEIQLLAYDYKIAGVIEKAGENNTVVEVLRIKQGQLRRELEDTAEKIGELEAQDGKLVQSLVDVAGKTFTVGEVMNRAVPEAKEFLRWLKELAITSPFTVQEVANVSAFAMSFGFARDETKKLLPAIMNFTAGMGLSDAVMQRIILNFGQMKNAGKVTGRELMDLARGSFMPIKEIFAEMGQQFGLTADEMQEKATSGLVDVDEFFKAFIITAERDFPGAMQRMSETFGGVMSNIKDFIGSIIGGDLLGPVVAFVSKGLAGLLQSMLSDEFRKTFEDAGLTLRYIFEATLALTKQLISSFSDLGGKLFSVLGIDFSSWTLKDAIINVGLFLQGLLKSATEWVDVYSPAIVAAFRALKDWWDTNYPLLVAKFEELRSWFDDNWPKVISKIGELKTWFDDNWPLLEAYLKSLPEKWDATIVKIGNARDKAQEFLDVIKLISAGQIVPPSEPAGPDDRGGKLSSAFVDLMSLLSQMKQYVSIAKEISDSVLPDASRIAAVTEALNNLKTAWENLLTTFSGHKTTMEDLSGGFGKLLLVWNALVLGWQAGNLTLTTGLLTLAAGVLNFVSGVWESVTSFWNLLVSLFTFNTETIKMNWDLWLEGLKAEWDSFWQIVLGILMISVGPILMFLGTFFLAILESWKKLDDDLVGHSIIPEMMQKILKAITDKLTEILTAVKTFIDIFKSAFSNEYENFRKLGMAIMDNVILGITMKVSQLVATVSRAVRDTIDAAGKELGLPIGAGGNSDWESGDNSIGRPGSYAHGGIASGPTSGYSATLHGTEAVIPLSGGRYVPVMMNNSRNSESVQITIPLYLDGREIGRASVDGTIEELGYRGLRVVPVA